MCQKRGQRLNIHFFVNHSITASSSGMSISIPISSAESSSLAISGEGKASVASALLFPHPFVVIQAMVQRPPFCPQPLDLAICSPDIFPSTAGHLDSCPFHTSTRTPSGESSLTGPTVISARDQTKKPSQLPPALFLLQPHT